ncbi:VapE domain-containing protein [Paraburkholderia caribensis]|uniref:VapE domain-containing protein n=1 Tax=Paraburkholderia caribensis TaxID=75105 RepID=UPI0007202981|nr:VapE domain-containing protein [Paraburkholderia caribensis]ALP62810.1 virulence protein E [Paraburkholderia caribensis]AUT51958.1 virulence protein E [Paraburkholderia caribensis]
MSDFAGIVGQLMAHGHPKLPDGHPVADGKPHRYGPKKKHWYSLHEVVKAGKVIGYTGAFGCWSGNDNGAQAFAWHGEALSPEDIAETRARQDALAREEERKRQHAAKLAANRARQQWQEGSDVGESDYLARKQITAEGVRFAADGDVLVPMFNYPDGYRLVGLQKITSTGAKRFNKGMEKKGALFLLGDINADSKVVLVAEGYATARSIRMATDGVVPVMVCFDAGNIMAAARYLRDTYAGIHVMFCADDDWQIERRLRDHLAEEFGYVGEIEIGGEAIRIESRKTWYMVRVTRDTDRHGVESLALTFGNDVVPERTRRFENTGLKHAFDAASMIDNASVIYPRFSARGDRKITDYNDLHVDEGLHVVKSQITAAILAGLTPADIKQPAAELAVDDAQDPLYDKAVRLVSEMKRASISAVQRSLRIGYNRAARLLDAMEQAAIVSPASQSGSRKVLAAHPTSAGAAGQTEDDPPDIEAENGAYTWMRDLRRAEKSGAILPTIDNVFLILSNDKRWSGVLAFEQFALRIVKRRAPPFEGGEVGEWTDADDSRLALWLGQGWGFSPRADIIAQAVFLVADRNRYHEVRDYLNGLTWDSTPRLHFWLHRWLHAEDTEYARLVGFKYLLGAVGRVMQPGCKMDNVLILEGAQDGGKSNAFRTLFGERWFTDANIVIGDKDSYAVMAGKWVIELAELDALNKSDSSSSKRFFTVAVDTYRPPYAKRAVDVPRQSVFGGTVNFDVYLKDESGGRRYWPVRCGDVLDISGLAENRDQIWAEAVHEYHRWQRENAEAGGQIWAPWRVTHEEKPLFQEEQEARFEGDVLEVKIARELKYRPRVTMEEVLDDILKIEITKQTPAEQRRVGKALKRLGWARQRETTGDREWYYVPPREKPVQMPTRAASSGGCEDDDAPL